MGHDTMKTYTLYMDPALWTGGSARSFTLDLGDRIIEVKMDADRDGELYAPDGRLIRNVNTPVSKSATCHTSDK